MKITKEQFEKEYAERSHTTIEELKKLGQTALPCDCEYEKCQGWQMGRSSPRIPSNTHINQKTLHEKTI